MVYVPNCFFFFSNNKKETGSPLKLYNYTVKTHFFIHILYLFYVFVNVNIFQKIFSYILAGLCP